MEDKTKQSSQEDLNKREELLNAKEQQLNKKETLLNERELELNKKADELAQLSSELESKQVNKSKPVKKAKGLSFTFRDAEYKFKDGSPQSIRFAGRAYTQKELSEDEDVLVQLIGGNSSLIEKI